MPESHYLTGGVGLGTGVAIGCGVERIQLTPGHDQLVASDRDRDTDADPDSGCLAGQTTCLVTKT